MANPRPAVCGSFFQQVKQDIRDTVISIIHADKVEHGGVSPEIRAQELSVLGVILIQELLASPR